MAGRSKNASGTDAAAFRALALAIEGASEAPHFDRAAFRTKQRIFATLASDGTANLRLDPEHQAMLVSARGEAFSIIPGGFGKMGWTRCLLTKISAADLQQILAEAHRLASAPAAKKRRTKRAR